MAEELKEGRIQSIENAIARTSKYLKAATNYPVGTQPHEDYIRELATAAETLAILCRNAAANATPASYEPGIFDETGEAAISKRVEHGVEVLTIPLLRPRSNRSLAQNYLAVIFHPLRRLVGVHKKGNYVLWFRNYYRDIHNHNKAADNDNIEIKFIVDMVTLFMGVDDAPCNISIFKTGQGGETDKTDVWIIPMERFPYIMGKELGDDEKNVST